MAKDIHFKFFIGDKAVCVEGGGGYSAPAMLDTVTLSVRKVNEKQAIGAREAVTHFADRNELASIGLAFLDVASKMTAQDMWKRSQTVGGATASIFPLSLGTEQAYKSFIEKVGQDLVRAPAVCFNKLRQRTPILQRAQYLLERVDDETAAQIDMLLTMLEHTGSFPFKMGLMPMPDGPIGGAGSPDDSSSQSPKGNADDVPPSGMTH